MKAVIMAGGEGTRLRPLTSSIPKPMVPIVNKPVMEHIINLVKSYDINDIAITMCYLPSVITDYFGDGTNLGVNLKYYMEEIPLGTGGSVLNAKDFLDDTFLVISGDALTDIDIKKALEFHKAKKSKATLILKKEPIPLEYGIVITDEDSKIVRFLEKPSWGEVFSDTINTGIYILDPEIFNYYTKGDNFDFSKDLFPKLLMDNIPMYGYVTDKYWCDIGDLRSYKQTHFDILNKKLSLLPSYKLFADDVWIGENTFISNNVKITPPVCIGNNCTIRQGVHIDSFTIIGDNCVIDEHATLKRSILWDKTYIGKNTQCRGTIISSKVNIKNNVNLFEDSVIGPECILSSGATIKPNIKIWPHKNIKENTIVNKNLVWGTKASTRLFGNRDVSGDINIEITPEFASLLGSAFASIMEKKPLIIVACDNSSASKAIKQSIISGILSTGAKVIDIGDILLPISRFAVRNYNGSAGVFISMDKTNKNVVHIEFVNEMGGNIDRKTEKQIEHLFVREDFQRCNADMINSVVTAADFSNFYIQKNSELFDNKASVSENNFNVLVSCPSHEVVVLCSTLLKYIGCKAKIDYSIKDFESIDSYIPYFSNKVKDNNFDIGIILSENGENILLIDETGRYIDSDKYIILASIISLKSGYIGKLVIPFTATRVIENIARNYNVGVIRTKCSASEIMNEMLKLVRDTPESIIQYILNFDGILASGKIVEFLINEKISLKQLIDEIPDFYIKRQSILCDFKDRGRIIRELIEDNKDNDIELFEGIKINTNKGWTLIMPDNEKPVFNIFSEGFSEEYAEELSSFINDKVKNLLNKKNKSEIE